MSILRVSLLVFFSLLKWCGLNVVLGVGESCLAFRDFSSLRTHFRAAYRIRLLYVIMAYVKHTFYADAF